MNRIKKISNGDMDALEELYEQYKVPVYRIALSLTGNCSSAEDITQDTFLRIQEKADTCHHMTSEAAWIYTIARNIAYDVLRKRSRESYGENEVIYGQASGKEDPEAGEYIFLDLIKNLSDEEAEIVRLRILADLSFKEISRIMRISAGTCNKRYHRALEKLRKELQM